MNKYRNIKTCCLLGHGHDSKLEAAYCNELLCRQKSGKIVDYKIQVPFILPGKIKHVVDFVVYIDKSGKWEVHEAKGYKTQAWRMKHKLFLEFYPSVPYIIIEKVERREKCQRGKKSKDPILKRIKVYR